MGDPGSDALSSRCIYVSSECQKARPGLALPHRSCRAVRAPGATLVSTSKWSPPLSEASVVGQRLPLEILLESCGSYASASGPCLLNQVRRSNMGSNVQGGWCKATGLELLSSVQDLLQRCKSHSSQQHCKAFQEEWQGWQACAESLKPDEAGSGRKEREIWQASFPQMCGKGLEAPQFWCEERTSSEESTVPIRCPSSTASTA